MNIQVRDRPPLIEWIQNMGLVRSADKPAAIIIGLASMQGLQAARILAQKGIPVIALADDPDYYCCRTNVCQEIKYVDTRTDAFVELLEEMGPHFNSKPVLFPCQDENVWHLSCHRTHLSQWYHFLLPDHDVLKLLMDKSLFYKFAQEQGYPVPNTTYVHNDVEFHAVSQKLNFPCLVKPSSRTGRWSQHSAFKAYKIANKVDLIALYNVCKDWTDTLLIQEWIEGTDADLYSCNCYYNADSQPLATFVARKIRQYPPEAGESSLGAECHNDVVLEVTRDLFKKVGMRGLGYLEMKRDCHTGKHYIIEPNIGRPTGRSAIAEAGGVEILYTMYCDLLGWPLPENRTQKYTGVKWIHFTRDCASAFHYWRKGELSLAGWLKSVRGKKAYAVLSIMDPMPFFADILRTVRLLLSGKERKRRDANSMMESIRQTEREDGENQISPLSRSQ